MPMEEKLKRGILAAAECLLVWLLLRWAFSNAIATLVFDWLFGDLARHIGAATGRPPDMIMDHIAGFAVPIIFAGAVVWATFRFALQTHRRQGGPSEVGPDNNRQAKNRPNELVTSTSFEFNGELVFGKWFGSKLVLETPLHLLHTQFEALTNYGIRPTQVYTGPCEPNSLGHFRYKMEGSGQLEISNTVDNQKFTAGDGSGTFDLPVGHNRIINVAAVGPGNPSITKISGNFDVWLLGWTRAGRDG